MKHVCMCKARWEQRKCIYINQVIVKVNDMVRNQQNPQHMVCHAVARRVKLNCPSNVSRAVGFQLPQDLPPVWPNYINSAKMIYLSGNQSNALLNGPIIPCLRCIQIDNWTRLWFRVWDTLRSVRYPLFGLHMDNAYRFDRNWSTPTVAKLMACAINSFKIHCVCYEMAVQAIEHANHICSGCYMAHLNCHFNAQGVM